MGLRHQIAVFAFICFGLLGCAQPAAEIAQSTETATEPNPTATAVPSDTPTVAPTATETLEPTQASTATLTNTPTPSPTESPTITPIPDLNTALGAHYTFSGNAEDSTGNENHGAVTGATLIEDRFGRPDEAYLFDGIDDFIEVAHSGTIGLQFDSTVSAWVFVEEQVEDTWYSVIEKTDPERHGHSRWGIWLIGDQAEFCVQTYSVPFHYCLDSLEPVGPEKWHHIVGVWTGDTIKLYIDGELSIEKNAQQRCDFQYRSSAI
ncbi:MAG: LamG-like jellyroll fold domain-containing protein, partial [Chloroflexota bacterium]